MKLLPATTQIEWTEVQGLIQELIAWDVNECERLGFARDDVVRTFYPATLADIRRQSAAPRGCFLIADDQGVAVGCAAYRPLAEDICELYDVYVCAKYRGRGIASDLVKQLQSSAAAAGYRMMYLETASFMTNAQTLYRSLGFESFPHYRSVPDQFVAGTISMRCAL